MKDKFSEKLSEFETILSECYIAVTPIISHSGIENTASKNKYIKNLFKDHKCLSYISRTNDTEIINLEPVDLVNVAEHLINDQISSFFDVAVNSIGFKLPTDASRVLRDCFLSDFEKVEIYTNAAPDWSSWSPVSKQVRDMLIVAIDASKARMLFAVCPD